MESENEQEREEESERESEIGREGARHIEATHAAS